MSNGSRLIIRHATAGNFGGGLYALSKIAISRSTLSIQDAAAQAFGGGFLTLQEVVIDEMSSLRISDSRSQQGGGFQSEGTLAGDQQLGCQPSECDRMKSRRRFHWLWEVEIAGHSTVNVSNSHAESGHGGGFRTRKGLKVSNGSRLIIRNATAGKDGGGFYATGRALISRSAVSIEDATVQQSGGGFFALDVVIEEMSSVRISTSDRYGAEASIRTDACR